MSDPTPDTEQCRLERDTADPVPAKANIPFETWPGNLSFTPPLTLRPRTLAQLANAILQAESAGHRVRAFGSKWSFSDAVIAGSSDQPGAMIATDDLNTDLSNLPRILATGVDQKLLHHVQAGMNATDLTSFLAQRGQMLEAGGASGQSVAGMMSTSTHSADCLVPPFVEYIRAIHLVGAGGIEHWIERDQPVTDPVKLQEYYPCLAEGNIHYDNELFNAALVSAGSMGVIYSVIIEAVPIYAVHQHRVATTWEQLLTADPDLSMVIDGSYMQSFPQAGQALKDDIFGVPINMTSPFEPNTFAQIVINPYPFYGNDHTLTAQEQARIGEHLCFVTNRVKLPKLPDEPYNPKSDDDPEKIGRGMLQAAFWSLDGLWNPDAFWRFHNFSNGVGQYPDLSAMAAAAVDFLADYWPPATISAMTHYVLQAILPVGDRWDINLSEVQVWGNRIRGFGMEAAFPIPGAIAFVHKVFDLIKAYAARRPQAYVGGYLSLRIVGKSTNALIGMQRWSPTCHVEYIGIAGTRDLPEFVDDLQTLALSSGGILHLGLENNVMTAAHLRNAHGSNRIDTFRWARGVLSQNGTLTTFDNSFTDRLGLSAVGYGAADISHFLPLLLEDGDNTGAKAALTAASTLLL